LGQFDPSGDERDKAETNGTWPFHRIAHVHGNRIRSLFSYLMFAVRRALIAVMT
jgi:hypothetical protein